MDDSSDFMTDVQTRALTRSRSFLVQNLILANITNDLVTEGVFSEFDLRMMKGEPEEKIRQLLTDLVRLPRDCYEKFISILENKNHPHCAAEIRRNEDFAVNELLGTQAPYGPSVSTFPLQPAEQEAKLPVQETNEGRQHSAGMSSFPSTGTSQARSSSPLPSGATNSDDDLDCSDAGRQLNNPGPQLQGASPMPEQVLQNEEMHPGDVYKHETTPRGLALIINNVTFEHLDHRTGTESDCNILFQMLTEFGIKVRVLDNLKAQEMEQRIREFAMNTELQKVDSCVLAIMSHGGDHGKICGIDYDPQPKGPCITVDGIKDMLNGKNCPHMKGKPKFLIIQACRGDKEDTRRNVRGGRARRTRPQTDTVEKEVDIEPPASSSLREPELRSNVTARSTRSGRNSGRRTEPLMKEADVMDIDDGTSDDEEHEMADFFIAYATCSQYAAYRLDRGSPFIKTLVEVFREHAHNTHVADMLTKVNNKMSATRHNEKRLVASWETTLRYKFFLNPPRP